MKPIRLELTSFGPFIGTHVIDFTLLEDRSFLLIHGPTGSGKTMLLDAMCYALYGETSGGERNPENMRSDFVNRDQRTEVVFEFSLRGQTYRVFRSMRYLRPKERGLGMTEALPRAELHDISRVDEKNPRGIPLASGPSRVTEMVENLLGFKGDQFRQVVILPQGQFRRLLMADSRGRQIIMEALFRTGLYKRMEEYFKQQAKIVEGQAKALQDQTQFLLNEVDCIDIGDLKGRITNETENSQDLGLQLQNAKVGLAKAQEELLLGQQTEKKLLAQRKAEKMHAELRSRQGLVDEQRLKLGKGLKALQLMPFDDSMQKRYNEHKKAEMDYQQSRVTLTKAEEQSQKAQNTYIIELGREAERKKAHDRLQWLQGLSEAFAQHQKACEERVAITHKLDTAQERMIRINGKLAEIQGSLADSRKAYQSAQEEARQRELLRMEANRLDRELVRRQALHQAQIEAQRIDFDLKQALIKMDAAQKYLEQLRNEQDEMQRAWEGGHASLLARTLTEGSPCPVCGSLAHPAPAAGSTDLPGPEALKNKRRLLGRAEKDFEKARANATELQTQETLLKDRIRGIAAELGALAEQDPVAIKQALELCRQRHQSAERALLKEQQLLNDINRFEETEKQVLLQISRFNEELDLVRQQLASAEAVRIERKERLPENIADETALKRAQQKAKFWVESLDRALEDARIEAEEKQRRLSVNETRVKTLRQTALEAKVRFEEEQADFSEKLLEAGFEKAQDYEIARRPVQQLRQLEADINSFDLSLRSARDHLLRCQKEAEGLISADITLLQTQFDKISEERDRIYSEHTLAKERLTLKKNRLQTLERLEKQSKEIEGHYQVLGHLANVANGKNPRNITFQSFVLGALLDDVIITSSRRLKILSKGRFLLQRSQEKTRANAPAGLNINIYDHYTSTSRPVASLSGGESFLASLALALGLAEVVQSYAGGTQLDAIFIDEGFGSLDANSLDDAVKILFDLREQGRLVGIISHIDELQERIDTRLEVRKSETGSHLHFALS